MLMFYFVVVCFSLGWLGLLWFKKGLRPEPADEVTNPSPERQLLRTIFFTSQQT